jgi:hypothetical protein
MNLIGFKNYKFLDLRKFLNTIIKIINNCLNAGLKQTKDFIKEVKERKVLEATNSFSFEILKRCLR